MDDSPASISTPYKRLQARSDDTFPLRCPECQRQFTDLKDYLAHTTRVTTSSGLAEHTGASGTFVLLTRNCLCGTPLPLECRDRRDQTAAGVSRRNRFASLVTLLTDTGMPLRQAEAEVRRLLALSTP